MTCYRSDHFVGCKDGHLTEVWTCYSSDHFVGCKVGHLTEV